MCPRRLGARKISDGLGPIGRACSGVCDTDPRLTCPSLTGPGPGPGVLDRVDCVANHGVWGVPVGWMASLVFLTGGAVVHASEPPVVNGAPEPDFPTVISLGADVFGERLSLCTGNLITSRLILTAAHCTDFIPTELLVVAGRAYVGADIWNAEYELPLVDRFVHPNYVELDAEVGELGSYDISLVVLESDAPVRPMWMRLEPLDDSLLGLEMVSIGFGLDEDEVSGVKRSAILTLDELDEMFLISRSATNPDGATICSGDSGGPQVAWVNGEWEQWGVHSWGDARCRMTSGSQRVDLALDWVLDGVQQVHGTRDLCVANGWAGDGTCDARCEIYGAMDPDCASPDADADAAGRGDSTSSDQKQGCTVVPIGGWAMFGCLGLLVVAGRRRQGDP